MHPSLTAVVSSNIAGYRYDPVTLDLVVAFVRDSHYLYKGVPHDVVAAFEFAPSKGTFFGVNIRKGGYTWRRLPDESEVAQIFRDVVVNPLIVRNTSMLKEFMDRMPSLRRIAF